MNEYCCTYCDGMGMDWGFFFYTILSLIYACLPVTVVISGVGFVLGSINHEPWGYHFFGPGILIGIIMILFGIVWGIIR